MYEQSAIWKFREKVKISMKLLTVEKHWIILDAVRLQYGRRNGSGKLAATMALFLKQWEVWSTAEWGSDYCLPKNSLIYNLRNTFDELTASIWNKLRPSRFSCLYISSQNLLGGSLINNTAVKKILLSLLFSFSY